LRSLKTISNLWGVSIGGEYAGLNDDPDGKSHPRIADKKRVQKIFSLILHRGSIEQDSVTRGKLAAEILEKRLEKIWHLVCLWGNLSLIKDRGVWRGNRRCLEHYGGKGDDCSFVGKKDLKKIQGESLRGLNTLGSDSWGLCETK